MPRTGRTPTTKQLAHIVDRKGRIDVIARRAVVTPMLLVKSTDHDLIEWLLYFGGWEREKGKVADDVLLDTPDPNRVRRWAWRCYNDEAVRLVKAVRPWLTVELKQYQADLLTMVRRNEYGEWRLELNTEIVAEMEHTHVTGRPSGRLDRLNEIR